MPLWYSVGISMASIMRVRTEYQRSLSCENKMLCGRIPYTGKFYSGKNDEFGEYKPLANFYPANIPCRILVVYVFH